MDTLTYWNGTWHEGNPAILGPRDHAFWLGSMVFDGGRAFEGCGPDLDLHAERVVRSARALGLKPTKTAKEILDLMHEAVRRFGPKAELYVRPMFWATKGGAGPDLGRRRFHAVPALRLSRADARRHAADARPLPLDPPADARERADRRQGKLPLSQLQPRRRRDAGARLPERHRARRRWATSPRPAAPISSWPRTASSARRCPTAPSSPASRATAR